MIESKIYGRKYSILFSYIFISIGTLSIYFLKEKGFFIILSLVKSAAAIAFTIIYPYTAELYNTFMRTTSSGFLSMVCRLGGVSMPWIVNYLFLYGIFAPFLSIFAISILSAISTYLLPKDTIASKLDESISSSHSEE